MTITELKALSDREFLAYNWGDNILNVLFFLTEFRGQDSNNRVHRFPFFHSWKRIPAAAPMTMRRMG